MSQIEKAREVAALFLRLGVAAFGGPAAHIALMREEVVDKRSWMDDQHFLDLIGATNLIPGPNSSEMALHIGYTRAGLLGLLAAGTFILPAFTIVLALSWAYITFGDTPVADAFLYGIQPVIIPIIVSALIKLSKKAYKGLVTGVIGAAVLGLFLLDARLDGINIDNVFLMLGGGLLLMLIWNAGGRDKPEAGVAGIFAPLAGLSVAPLIQTAAASFSLWVMFLTFLKIGSVLYGSGYTLFAFLQDDFVLRLGWLEESVLIDAIAIGQMTPGPVVTTSTFIGYYLGEQVGRPFIGALLATLGMYIPSFTLVAVTNPIIPKIRDSKWLGAFLDGVNVAALGLMAAVTLQLAWAAIRFRPEVAPIDVGLPIDPLAILIGIVAAVALFRYKVSSIWLVAGGAVAGVIVALVG